MQTRHIENSDEKEKIEMVIQSHDSEIEIMAIQSCGSEIKTHQDGRDLIQNQNVKKYIVVLDVLQVVRKTINDRIGDLKPLSIAMTIPKRNTNHARHQENSVHDDLRTVMKIRGVIAHLRGIGGVASVRHNAVFATKKT
jgi:hypothetical protein